MAVAIAIVALVIAAWFGATVAVAYVRAPQLVGGSYQTTLRIDMRLARIRSSLL
jgi:hypothetical protein